MTITIKPLEWEYHERPMMTYVVSDERGLRYHINQYFGSDSYYFATVRHDGNILYDGDDLPSAQAAAQADYEARILSALAPQAGDNAEEPEAWIIRCKGWGEELSFTEAGAKELAEKLENIPGVKRATITPLYARPDKGGDGKDDIPAPAEHSVSAEAVGDPEAWLFHETPHRPQTIDPRWMSINQINKHIAALEGELRARAALPVAPDATP